MTKTEFKKQSGLCCPMNYSGRIDEKEGVPFDPVREGSMSGVILEAVCK